MWYRDLLIYYAETVLSVTAHELSHLAVAMGLGMKNPRIVSRT